MTTVQEARVSHGPATATLIGTAVGDAIGLPWEGISRRRQAKLRTGALEHSLLARRGMISDDTEHSFMVAQSLLAAGQDVEKFRQDLARRFRWWLVALPAGVGLATLRSIVRLWFGVNPKQAGVYSAGNGPAMRSAVIGVHIEDPELRRAFVRASTLLTHRDPRAEVAAAAVAEVARFMASGSEDVEVLLATLRRLDDGDEWADLVRMVSHGLGSSMEVQEFCTAIGADRAVSGYAYQSVPVAIYAALRHRDDFRRAIESVVACGGDTDTVAAITGGMLAARVGLDAIPASWRNGVVDWPRSMGLLERLGQAVDLERGSGRRSMPVRYCWPAIPFRNAVFLGIVLLHGFRRLFPPY